MHIKQQYSTRKTTQK